jgi:hypothetical protein
MTWHVTYDVACAVHDVSNHADDVAGEISGVACAISDVAGPAAKREDVGVRHVDAAHGGDDAVVAQGDGARQPLARVLHSSEFQVTLSAFRGIRCVLLKTNTAG